MATYHRSACLDQLLTNYEGEQTLSRLGVKEQRRYVIAFVFENTLLSSLDSIVD